ncbi:MAG: TIGR02186 family protein [Hyphomonadaceae bacterium]|nr:TIGR02186 family protein [Hyphomonadaceae bacterium]
MRAALLLLAALAAVLLAPPAAHAQALRRAPDLATSISDEAVSVTSDYRGARLTVFGVHWRRGRAPSDVVVVLRGPSETQVVRRKRRIAGLWINTDPVRFRGVPSFFALASTRPVGEFLDGRTVTDLGLDPGALARLEGETPADTDSTSYRRALVRLKQAEGLYVLRAQPLLLEEDGAFKATFTIPANAPVGVYGVDVFLFRGGRLVQRKPDEIVISRIGIEKTIYNAAQRDPLLYGLAAVALALASGYAAAFAFQRR